MAYSVYVIYSESCDKIYIGYTSNLLLRIFAHNNFNKGWTSKFKPWVVIYCEYFEEQSEATRRESQLKTAKARKIIRQKIETQFKPLGYIDGLAN